MPSDRSRRNIQRLREILEIAADRGFGYFIVKTGLTRFLPSRLRGRRHSEIPSKEIGIHIRKLLEDLGPTFVKLGQLLSVRPDITPPHILIELEKLQDTVPPFAITQVRQTIFEELGKHIEDLFEYFEENPLASASIGQVHRARLFDGAEVAVKVRRPNIIEAIEADLDLLEFAAAQLRNRIEFIDPMMIISEFRQSLKRELDYTNEAKHADRFRANFADDKVIKIPIVHWDLTTEKVLTTEFIDGTKVSDIKTVEAGGIDYSKLACKGAEAFMKQVLEDGFFHGDLHPGNILITHDGRIAYLDFGIVGEISDTEKETIILLLMAVIKQDSDEIIARLRQLGVIVTPETLDALKADLRNVISKYYGRKLDELKLAHIGREFLHVVYHNRIRIPKSYALLAKAIVTVEGVAVLLCPDINIFDIAKPYVERLVKQQYFKKLTKEEVLEQMKLTLYYATQWPGQIHKVLERLVSGDLTVRIQQIDTDRAISEHVRSRNRVASAGIAAAFLLASSIVFSSSGISAVAIIFFVTSVILLVFLAAAIKRSGGL